MQSLTHWDHILFQLINRQWHNDLFDWLMPLLRNATLWIPLYLFFILFATINFKKTGWWWILFAGATVIITNSISSDVVKEIIPRIRPCNDPSIAGWVRVLVGYRPQSSSFTSSHAANHFGLAMFMFLTLKKQFHKWPLIFFAWAFIIGYAQVYVGVHYPLDIAGGTLIGIVIGYLSGRSFNKNYGLE